MAERSRAPLGRALTARDEPKTRNANDPVRPRTGRPQAWPALAVAALLAAAAPGQAQEADPAQTLERVEQDLAAAKSKQKELSDAEKKAAAELKDVRERLVAAAADQRKREDELAKLEERLATLEAEEADRLAALSQRREALADLVAALQRLSRTPPAAMATRADRPVETARGAMLLRSAIPLLRARAEALAQELGALLELRQELARRRAEAEGQREELARREKELTGLLLAREKLLADTAAERKAVADRMAALSREADDLRTLMERLEQDRLRREEERRRREAEEAARRALADRAAQTAAMAKGTPPKPPPSEPARPTEPPQRLQNGVVAAVMPVGGRIVQRYGQRDDVGSTSRGLTIATRSGSTIVAPMAGTVMFAGSIKGYGETLILEHRDGYHSVIAGVDRIDVSVGQEVTEGEPIGRIEGGAGGESRVYFELRRNNQPINPQLGS